MWASSAHIDAMLLCDCYVKKVPKTFFHILTLNERYILIVKHHSHTHTKTKLNKAIKAFHYCYILILYYCYIIYSIKYIHNDIPLNFAGKIYLKYD